MTPTAKPTRKRHRKRKRRRLASSSSSSSDSSDSSPSSDEGLKRTPVIKASLKKQLTRPSPSAESSPAPSLSSSSPSSPDSKSDDDAPHAGDGSKPVTPPVSSRKQKAQRSDSDSDPAKTPHRSPSHTPPPADAPPFLPAEGSSGRVQDEQALRNRFRQFWMASVADAFGSDLEQIRQEPNMTKSRLALLIDSLASGGEVFSSHAGENGGLNEMDMVLNKDNEI